MAYKNQKKNKAHIAKLKADPNGWHKRQQQKKINTKRAKTGGYTAKDLESIMRSQGLI